MKLGIIAELLSWLLMSAAAKANLLRGVNEHKPDRQLWDEKNLDVAFIIDGSTQGSSKAFQMQIDGIVKTIENSGIVPRDGSVAISVIQNDAQTPIPIPHSLITNEEDVEDLVTQIKDLKQTDNDSMFFPGEAVRMAHKSIRRTAFETARQIFCMTTANTGEEGKVPLNKALGKAAERSWYHLDTFSVVAISGTTPDAEFEAKFGALTSKFGGSLNIADNSKSFETSLRVACFGKDPGQVNAIIISPNPGAVFAQDANITLKASVNQPFDLIVWFVDDKDVATGEEAWILARDFDSTKDHTLKFIATLTSTNKPVVPSIKQIFRVNPPFNNPPQVQIDYPVPFQTFETDQVIELKASAFDREDGRLKGKSIIWSSHADAMLSMGSHGYVNAEEMYIGRHRITVRATDSGGRYDEAFVNIKVTEGPLVAITSPVSGRVFNGEILELLATVSTADGQKINDNSIIWESRVMVDGVTSTFRLGTGEEASVSSGLLRPGQQEIFCTATDNKGKKGADSLILVVSETAGGKDMFVHEG